MSLPSPFDPVLDEVHRTAASCRALAHDLDGVAGRLPAVFDPPLALHTAATWDSVVAAASRARLREADARVRSTRLNLIAAARDLEDLAARAETVAADGSVVAT